VEGEQSITQAIRLIAHNQVNHVLHRRYLQVAAKDKLLLVADLTPFPGRHARSERGENFPSLPGSALSATLYHSSFLDIVLYTSALYYSNSNILENGLVLVFSVCRRADTDEERRTHQDLGFSSRTSAHAAARDRLRRP
jgi:hypothetical protein